MQGLPVVTSGFGREWGLAPQKCQWFLSSHATRAASWAQGIIPFRLLTWHYSIGKKTKINLEEHLWKKILGISGCFQKIVVPQNGWFIMEIPIKMDDLGGKPPIFGNIHLQHRNGISSKSHTVHLRPAEEVKPRRQYELHLLEAPTKLPNWEPDMKMMQV